MSKRLRNSFALSHDIVALRTNAYEGDGELDGYSEDDTGSQGLPQGMYFHP